MSEYLENAIRKFKAYCSEREVSVGDHAAGELMLTADARRFEQQEQSVGSGKTRRPTINIIYFEDVIRRVLEVKRREREDIEDLFGER